MGQVTDRVTPPSESGPESVQFPLRTTGRGAMACCAVPNDALAVSVCSAPVTGFTKKFAWACPAFIAVVVIDVAHAGSEKNLALPVGATVRPMLSFASTALGVVPARASTVACMHMPASSGLGGVLM